MAGNIDLKYENIQKVRICFYDGKVWTKNQLASQTQLSLASTTNVLAYLLENQEIRYIGDASSTGGRKSKEYQIQEHYKHIGIMNLMKSNAYGMITKTYDLFGHELTNQQIHSDSITVIEIKEELQKLISNDPLVDVIIISIPGICIQGKVDVCDIESLNGVDLVTLLQNSIHKTILVENDVNVACIGFAHEYPDYKNICYMYQPGSDYIGCGIVLDGKLYNGFSHFAGELRYLPFYNNERQEELLKSDPEHLLLLQMATLATVINPEIIGYTSDCFSTLTRTLEDYRIPKHHQPNVVERKNISYLIEQGLLSIGLKYIKENKHYEN